MISYALANNAASKSLRARACARSRRRRGEKRSELFCRLILRAGRFVMTELRTISRRQVLTIAAGATGASISGTTAIIGTSTPAQAAKVPQKIVKYQDTP